MFPPHRVLASNQVCFRFMAFTSHSTQPLIQPSLFWHLRVFGWRRCLMVFVAFFFKIPPCLSVFSPWVSVFVQCELMRPAPAQNSLNITFLMNELSLSPWLLLWITGPGRNESMKRRGEGPDSASSHLCSPAGGFSFDVDPVTGRRLAAPAAIRQSQAPRGGGRGGAVCRFPLRQNLEVGSRLAQVFTFCTEVIVWILV